MPNYSVPDDIVNDLVAAYRSVTPADVADPNRADNADDIYALAEMMAIAECMAANWTRMAIVSTSSGPYLELLARGAGIKKQSGESDESLRQRIRTPPLSVTPDLILQALQQLVNAFGGGTVYLLELPADGLFVNRSSYVGRNGLIGATGVQVVIALVPASANVLGPAAASLAQKVTAAKVSFALEY